MSSHASLGQTTANPVVRTSREFFCETCNSRCTRGTTGLEYGHKIGCPERPDHFPDSVPVKRTTMVIPMNDELFEQELQAEALEAIATELRYQNAVLCELLEAMDDLSARVSDHHHAESEPRDRSGRALQRDIEDRLFERDRDEDELPEFRWGQPENWQDGDER